jgi:hypothetical protein
MLPPRKGEAWVSVRAALRAGSAWMNVSALHENLWVYSGGIGRSPKA